MSRKNWVYEPNIFKFFLLFCFVCGHDSNVARAVDKANMYSQPTEIHEDSVARPLFPTAKRDEKNLGVLGCKNPTVMITRTRSVFGGTPHTGIVDSGAIRRVEADAVQGSLVPQPVGHVGVGTCSDSKKEIKSLQNKRNYARRKDARKFVYFEKTKKFEPASQVELLKNNNVGNSENNNSENNTTGDKARVCTNSDRSKSIRTHIAGSVIEE